MHCGDGWADDTDLVFHGRLMKMSAWVGRVLRRDFSHCRTGGMQAAQYKNYWVGICQELFFGGQVGGGPSLCAFMTKLVPGTLEQAAGMKHQPLLAQMFLETCKNQVLLTTIHRLPEHPVPFWPFSDWRR
jgi:hypothetical protein